MAMAAIGACLALGCDLQKTTALLAGSHGVPGRFEVLRTGTPYTVIRDYAHTPDAIEKVLSALRAVTCGKNHDSLRLRGQPRPEKAGPHDRSRGPAR